MKGISCLFLKMNVVTHSICTLLVCAISICASANSLPGQQIKAQDQEPKATTPAETESKASIKLVEAKESTNTSESIKVQPNPTLVALRKRVGPLKPRIESILKHYFLQKENSASRSPWGIMHAMVAFGPYAEMYAEGQLMKDVDWLCQNGRCRSWTLLKLEDGQLSTNNGPGRQGHDGQFLAILAQSQVPREQELIVEGKKFTIKDLIRYEMDTCRPGTELTFKLIGLSHYIESDAIWKSNDGQRWSLERILKEELKQPINGVACGGTHRLMGYSYSLLMRKLQGKPITGYWKKADEFVSDFRKYALSMQNRDGSFSTDWFKSRQAKRDSQRRVQTTGHILEWLVFSATDEELADRRIVNSVDYLSRLMWNEKSTKWEVGPKGHAIRALRLYYERVMVDPAAKVADAKSAARKSINDGEAVRKLLNR